MPLPVNRGQTIISMQAGQTLTAYRVVKLSSAGHVALHDTTTALLFGITADNSVGGSDSSVPIVIAGTAKVACAASVSAGALVTAQSATASGLIMEVGGSVNNTTTSAVPRVLGMAITAGSTNSVIEVLLQINNTTKLAY